VLKHIALAVLVILSVGFTSFLVSDKSEINLDDPRFVTHTVDLKSQTLKFYWRNDEGSIYNNFTTLRDDLSKRNEELVFAMSKKTINFYDFASFFKIQGCKNALYLDGFVSRTYLPSKNWIQMDGNFGVIIAETRKKE